MGPKLSTPTPPPVRIAALAPAPAQAAVSGSAATALLNEAECYWNRYPDVASNSSFGRSAGLAGARKHFDTFGQKEGRIWGCELVMTVPPKGQAQKVAADAAYATMSKDQKREMGLRVIGLERLHKEARARSGGKEDVMAELAKDLNMSEDVVRRGFQGIQKAMPSNDDVVTQHAIQSIKDFITQHAGSVESFTVPGFGGVSTSELIFIIVLAFLFYQLMANQRKITTVMKKLFK